MYGKLTRSHRIAPGEPPPVPVPLLYMCTDVAAHSLGRSKALGRVWIANAPLHVPCLPSFEQLCRSRFCLFDDPTASRLSRLLHEPRASPDCAVTSVRLSSNMNPIPDRLATLPASRAHDRNLAASGTRGVPSTANEVSVAGARARLRDRRKFKNKDRRTRTAYCSCPCFRTFRLSRT